MIKNLINLFKNLLGALMVIFDFGKKILVLVLGLMVLNLTNPTTDDFSLYYVKKIKSMKEKEDTGLVDKIILEIKEVNPKMVIDRSDKEFFSLFTVSYFNKDEKYIGIAGKFIEVKKVTDAKDASLNVLKKGGRISLDGVKATLGKIKEYIGLGRDKFLDKLRDALKE